MKKLHSLIATLLVFSIILSMFSAVSFVSAAGTDIDVWDGTAATSFAGGAGTSANPYLIETPEQLFKAIRDRGLNGTTALYYLITADLYLNEDYENYKAWGETAPANNWYNVYLNLYNNSTAFEGHLDGGYHTIYGMYYSGGGYIGGLIPYLNNGGTVSNLIVTNSYIYKTGDSSAIIAGRCDNGKITNCIVHDSYISNASNVSMGGIVGWSSPATQYATEITNCGVYNLSFSTTSNSKVGGILGHTWHKNRKKAHIVNCYSVGKIVSGNTSDTAIEKCYTDASVLTGAGAVANIGFSTAIWKDTDSYPTFIGNGTKGETWRGTKAAWFADGDGTAADPYQIETPEQLFKAVCDLGKKADGTAAYYLITADLYLNKDYENYSAWGETAPANNWFTATYGEFKGHLDGGYHTVYGLYSSGNKWATGFLTFMGAGSSVSNLTITKAYIYNSANTAGGIAGSLKANTVIKNCMVYDAVISAKGAEGQNDDIGGIAGSAQTNTTTISNCGTYNLTLSGEAGIINAGGILGRCWTATSGGNGTRIHSSYSVDNYPLGNIGNTWVSHVYTNVSGSKESVVTKDISEMTGEAAVSGMNYLDFINTWQTVENGYPVLRTPSDNNLSQEITSSFAVTDNGKAGVKFTSKVAMPKINPTYANDIAITVNGAKKTVSEVGIIISRTGIDVADIATVENNPLTGYKVVGYQNGGANADVVINGGYITVTALVNGTADYVAKSYIVFADNSVVIGEAYTTAPSTEETTIDGVKVNDVYVNGDANFDGTLNVLDFIKTKNYLALGDEFTAKDYVLDVIDTDSDKDFGASDITALKKVLLVGNGENPTQP